MKRNKRKTFAYRPSDWILPAAFRFHKDRRNKQSIKWSWRMDLAGSISYRIIFWNTKYERYRSSDEMEDHWMYLQRNCAGSICDHFCDWNNCNDLSKERKR